MSSAPPSLADLRRRIDELDDALHDVLMARAAVVESVAKAKRRDATPPLRPGREAQIIRRLLARHRGAFPKPILVRLWRELLAGTLAIQLDLQLAVYAPENAAGLWDLARDHYGSHTAMAGFRSTGEVLRALGDGRATVGILPMPGQNDGEAWWRFLAGGDAAPLRIIARLPFGARGNARSDGGDAVVIGAIEPEESGADRSLYVIETGEELSRARLLAALAGIGLPAAVIAASEPDSGLVAQLVEFDAWIAAGDARLKDALAGLSGKALRIAWLGAYARPLSASDLAEAGRGR
ncbi:MAG TPA: chorismate mutase [Stellaceae bacterium]|jgi:chorismate mutase|nr:chorismate mutase [Stellaceae bacterium]